MYSRLLLWSLRHRRGAHVLNAIAIALASATVMVFVAVLIDFRGIMRSYHANRTLRVLLTPKLVQPGASTGGMPVTMLPTLQGIAGVKTAQHMLVFHGVVPGVPSYGISGEDDAGIDLNKDLYPTDAASIAAWKNDRLGALVTDTTATELHLEVGKVAEIPTEFGPLKIKVVGLLHGGLITRARAIHFD
jgi:hypothetical protein